MPHAPLVAALLSTIAPAPARAAAAARATALCPHVRVESADRLEFTALETKLACGDAQDPPWAKVPRNQARYVLGTFLAARGYYHVRFRDEPAALVADTGTTTAVTAVGQQGIPSEIDLTRYWRPLGEPLTTKLLDELERWVRDRLKANGYACPEVAATADPDSGRVQVTVDAGARYYVERVEEEPVPGLRPGVVRRYDAFEVGEVYDDEAVQLTARRTLGKQLLLSTHLSEKCREAGVVIHQKSLPGPPRLASVGFGFNTEQLAIVHGSLRNSRLGPQGSILDLTAKLGYREQDLTASADWYVLPYPSRFFLRPEVGVQRKVEPQAETQSTRAAFAPAATVDGRGFSLSGQLGPSLLYVRSFEKEEGIKFSRIHSLDGQVELRSHQHEYYAASPRTGYQAVANWSTAIRRGSSVTADRYGLNGEVLFNVAGFDPPKLILGLRGGYATTITGGSTKEFNELPATYLRVLGGSQNLRGFARHSLPDNEGALTTLFTGAEARLASIIPYQIEPLIFFDGGLAGKRSRYLEQPYYTSPGAGVRWQSPIGPMRLTAARGVVTGKDAEHHKGQQGSAFFFSFGEEF